MADIKDIRQYVIEHIDEAIEKEDIKIYYQPVIRTITGGSVKKRPSPDGMIRYTGSSCPNSSYLSLKNISSSTNWIHLSYVRSVPTTIIV